VRRPVWWEADAPRVNCREHGVVVCAVPWARHKSRFTRSFEDQAAWLAVNTSKKAVAELMRTAWRTVGQICERVMAEAENAAGDRFDGLRSDAWGSMRSRCARAAGTSPSWSRTTSAA
jgi:transposase